MITSTLSQPGTQLGIEFSSILSSGEVFTRIIMVSAFTSLRTILRLRNKLTNAANTGAMVRLIIGIDLDGTSKEVLEELVQWDECEIFIYHNPVTRTTFHPKIYLFECATNSILFIGSNNLTDGGLYTNYEAATKHVFNLPDDTNQYNDILNPIRSYIEPNLGPNVCRLDTQLITILSSRGIIKSDTEIRRNNRTRASQIQVNASPQQNPFSPVMVPMAPLLPNNIRVNLPRRHMATNQTTTTPQPILSQTVGLLVWKKNLSKTDALQVTPGSHHVGGIRLTQARYRDSQNNLIDQTTYFRRLFDDFDWEPEPGGRTDQEHTFIPIRIFILGRDHGIGNFEISHKPSGEAGQANYTTILRWGSHFNRIIARNNLTDRLFSLYETPNSDAPYLIEIT